jgi:hypothetical protein
LSKSTYLNANGLLLHRYFKKNLLIKSMYLDANGFHYIGTSKKIAFLSKLNVSRRQRVSLHRYLKKKTFFSKSVYLDANVFYYILWKNYVLFFSKPKYASGFCYIIGTFKKITFVDLNQCILMPTGFTF